MRWGFVHVLLLAGGAFLVTGGEANVRLKLDATLLTLSQREPPIPKELLERMGEWAERYPADLPSYAAAETIQQIRFNKKGVPENASRLSYHYSLQRLPGRGRELVESRVAAGDRQRSAAAAAGPEYFSKLVLLVTRLAARNHERMKYFFAPEVTEALPETVLVGYRQISGEGLMLVDGKPVYPSGRAWVNPEDGRVVRIEEEFSYKGTYYHTEVEFAEEASVGFWLPQRILVRIYEKSRPAVEHHHSYSDFRRLEPSDPLL